MGDDIRRISVRFYMNKARDVAAYEKLLEIAKKKDCSCNELLIELINQYQEKVDNTSEMAECIADIVVSRIEKHLSEMGKLVDVKVASEDINANADGPVEIGDDALSFISSFWNIWHHSDAIYFKTVASVWRQSSIAFVIEKELLLQAIDDMLQFDLLEKVSWITGA